MKSDKKISKIIYNDVLIFSTLPYLSLLRDWLLEGTLNDPCAEFLFRKASASATLCFEAKANNDPPFFLSKSKIRALVKRSGEFVDAMRNNGGFDQFLDALRGKSLDFGENVNIFERFHKNNKL